jgi:hypothetical protein
LTGRKVSRKRSARKEYSVIVSAELSERDLATSAGTIARSMNSRSSGVSGLIISTEPPAQEEAPSPERIAAINALKAAFSEMEKTTGKKTMSIDPSLVTNFLATGWVGPCRFERIVSVSENSGVRETHIIEPARKKRGPQKNRAEDKSGYRVAEEVEELMGKGLSQSEARHQVAKKRHLQYESVETWHKRHRKAVTAKSSKIPTNNP